MATAPRLIDDPQAPAAEADVVVVGGAGHVGFPLSLALADSGLSVRILDTSRTAVAEISAARSPHAEPGAETLLRRLLDVGRLSLSSTSEGVRGVPIVVLVVSLPDESSWSSVTALDKTIGEIAPYLDAGALLVLRNTLYPGTTAHVAQLLHSSGSAVDVAYCPERILQGHALDELHTLPQIVGADDTHATARAAELFGRLGVRTIRVSSGEAELAKLIANAWRYLTFAVANEIWLLSDAVGIDYDNVLHAVRDGYPRAQGLPGPGFAAGPCLVKDTAALAALAADRSPLLNAALQVNGSLPERIVGRMVERFGDLRGRNVGVLGMAFKAESDDTRNAPGVMLRDLLRRAGANVLCSDPFASDTAFLPLAEVVAQSEILVIAAPHSAYRELDVPAAQLVDIWGITKAGIVA